MSYARRHSTNVCPGNRVRYSRTKREIIRCLKRFLARELYQRVMTDFRMRQHGTEAA